MRARNVKPGLFKNEILAVSDPLHTVIFEGLWCYSDREGRCEDRPAKIHMEINAGRAFETTVRSIEWLEEQGFILRYQVGRAKYIQVLMFHKHQNPHHREPPSTIPPPTAVSPGLEPHTQNERPGHTAHSNGTSLGAHNDTEDISPGIAPGSTAVQGPSAVLIPDSGFLIPDSPSQPFPPSGKGGRRMNGENPRALGSNPRVNGHNPRAIRNRSLEAWRTAIAAIDHVKGTDLTWQYVTDTLGDPFASQAIEQAGGHRVLADRDKFSTGKLESRFREAYEQLLEREGSA